MDIVLTKTEIEHDEKTRRTAGFDNLLWSLATGKAGDVCVLWKEFQFHNISIELMIKEEIFMILLYTNPEINATCALFFVYASPQVVDKNMFRSLLSSMINSTDLPCIILGDLNEIFSEKDKKGDTIPTFHRFRRLEQFKNECHLTDIPLVENMLTWRKNIIDINNIYERLDKTLIHPQILEWFSYIHTKNHIFSSLDHCSISDDLKDNISIIP